MTTRKLKGIVPVLVSPLDEKGVSDTDGVSKLINSLIDAGVCGFWALGSTGEDVNIGYKSRIQLINDIVCSTDKRVPVITGTGEINVDGILRFIDKVETLHIDGIHVLYFDNKQSDKQMITELLRLAESSKFPIWLYHNPKRGKPVSTLVIKELREHSNIVGIKVGGYSLSDMIQALMLKTDSFQVIGAGGGQFYTMLSLGAHAHTASDACCWPEEFVRVYELYNSGKINEARELQYKLIQLNKAYDRTAFLDNGESAAEEKYILSLKGICKEFVNLAYRTLNEEEKRSINKALYAYGFDWASDINGNQ